MSISRRILRSFGYFSRLGRCGDSSSLTSQSFRASHDLYGHFSGDCLFSAESCSFIKGGGSSLAYGRVSTSNLNLLMDCFLLIYYVQRMCLQNNNRKHIQLKQSVRLVGLEESHIDKRALAEQGMERCVGPSLEVVLLCMVLNHKVMLLN
ncbi:hypothetical protein Peur_024516 [Populus x canadensis]